MTQTYAPNPTTLLAHWMRRGYPADNLALMTSRRPGITFTELALWADTQLPLAVMLGFSHLHPLSHPVRLAIWKHNGWDDEDHEDIQEWLNWASRYYSTPLMRDPLLEREFARESQQWACTVNRPEEAERYLTRGFTPDQARAFELAGHTWRTLDRLGWTPDGDCPVTIAHITSCWLPLRLSEQQLVALYTQGCIPDQVARLNDEERERFVVLAALTSPGRMRALRPDRS